jgi:hypothetical protein
MGEKYSNFKEILVGWKALLSAPMACYSHQGVPVTTPYGYGMLPLAQKYGNFKDI